MIKTPLRRVQRSHCELDDSRERERSNKSLLNRGGEIAVQIIKHLKSLSGLGREKMEIEIFINFNTNEKKH